MSYLYKCNSLHTILRARGFDQKQLAPLIYRGLIAGNKTEDLIRQVLCKPAGFRPFLPKANVDLIFNAMLALYAGGTFSKDGMRNMADWREMVNNHSDPGIIAREMLRKDHENPKNIKISTKLSPVKRPEETDDEFSKRFEAFKSKVERSYQAIRGWQRSLGHLKIIEDYLYYHADEISTQLGLK
jgi:hypothetical protein